MTDSYFLLPAEARRLEIEFEVRSQIVALDGTVLLPPRAAEAAAAAAAEERVEDVLQIHLDAAARPAAAAQSRLAVHVVALLLVRVAQRRVRLTNLFVPLGGLGRVVHVGVPFSRGVAEGALDRAFVGAARHAERLVEVAGHLQRGRWSQLWPARRVEGRDARPGQDEGIRRMQDT